MGNHWANRGVLIHVYSLFFLFNVIVYDVQITEVCVLIIPGKVYR